MDNFFVVREIGISIDLIVFVIFFMGLTIIRVVNPLHLNQVIGLNYFKNRKDIKSIFSKNDSKSSIFLNAAFVVFLSLTFQKTFSLSIYNAFLLGTSLYLFKLSCWFLLHQFIAKRSDLNFFRNRFMINETIAFLLFFYLAFNHFIDPNIEIAILFLITTYIFLFVRIAIILTNYISIFHNILYLCALEILPILIMVKLVTKYLI